MAELIDKWKVVDMLTALENEFQAYKPFHGFEHAMYRKLVEAEMEIGKMVAVEAEPVVHAHWKAVLEPNTVDTYGRPVYHAECSACGCYWGSVKEARAWFKRCRLCGAHMGGEVADG